MTDMKLVGEILDFAIERERGAVMIWQSRSLERSLKRISIDVFL
jgi:hypothetical protein